ncbi:MAG: FAD-dependent oxidoreductase [Candidatus Heimdallarchaeota archaeon]|nr:FAD-dependent oxidoreductase [Candidatus Heimdallarchaeota archaeon]MDH5645328.1 FAD-dependent oxidoreductase [Candidatus Heimdallarchaeota archaeon]
MTNTVLVIGGGPAGLEASRGVSDLGNPVILVEKNAFLGGNPIAERYAMLTGPVFRDAEEAMQDLIKPVTDDSNIKVHLSSTVTALDGELGNFTATITSESGTTESVTVGSVIIATGFKHFDPGYTSGAQQHWGYYEQPDVLTLTDLEKMLKDKNVVKPSNGKVPERVCFIQCVGSRDRQLGNQWCSKVCCGIACKQAIEIRELLPDTRVFIFYIDLRAYGFWEDELYWRAQEQHNVNFVKGVATEVIKRGDKLVVKGEDTTMSRPMEVEMDIVVLSVGMEPSQGTLDMANMLHLPLEDHGYIKTIGGPLNTTQTERPGVFAVGAAVGPADLEDSISSAGAAAMKAVSALRKLKLSAVAGD